MANRYTKRGRDGGGLPAEDEFVTFWGRAWNALLPHMARVAMGVAAIIILVAIVEAVSWFRVSSKQDATELLGRALRMHEAELLGENDKPRPEDDVRRFKTARERDEAVLAELDKLNKQYGSSGANHEARVLRASVLLDLGRTDEARAEWKKMSESAERGDPLALIAREGEGIALEAAGKHDEAIAVFKELQARGGDFLRDRARLDEARVLARQGKKDDAGKIYKEIVGKSPTGSLHDEAQNRLTALGG